MISSASYCFLALDLDNTLWKGLAGEHNITPVGLGDDGVGAAYKNFQRVVKYMQANGSNPAQYIIDLEFTDAGKEKFAFLFIPFFIHGCWDALISVGVYLMGDKFPGVVQALGFVMIIGIIVYGIVYSVKTFRNVKKLAVENESFPETETPESAPVE